MPWYLGNNGSSGMSMMGFIGWMIIPFLLWSITWKGLALWHAAKREDKPWFIILLIVNTMGILEIIYLALVVRLFTNKNPSKASLPPKKKKRK